MKTPILDATTADVTYEDVVDRWGSQFHQWNVELTYNGEQINVDYYTGVMRTDEPTAKDVVWSLIADDQTLQSGSTFEDWCFELGYNTDSINDRATYDLCIKNSQNVRRLYGSDFAAAQLEAEDL